MSHGFQVNPTQLDAYTDSVKAVADDAELANDAAKEISDSYDAGPFNLAYGAYNQDFGVRVQRIYDDALPLFREVVRATAFVAKQLGKTNEHYRHMDERVAHDLERVTAELDAVAPPPDAGPGTPTANSSVAGD